MTDTPSHEIAASTRRKPTIVDRLKANIPQKLIAFVCAFLLAIVVTSDRNMTMNFAQIPVMLNIPEGYVSVDDESTTTVDITISGRTSTLRGMTRDDLGMMTITPPARSGNIQITLQPSMLSLPAGVDIDKFQPEFLDVNLEPLETRTVAITTDHAFTGELLPGYRLGEVKIDPAEVKIMGPKSVVSTTGQLYIEPIDLTGKASTFVINRWVILNRNGLKTDSESVKVTVNIVSESKQHLILAHRRRSIACKSRQLQPIHTLRRRARRQISSRSYTRPKRTHRPKSPRWRRRRLLQIPKRLVYYGRRQRRTNAKTRYRYPKQQKRGVVCVIRKNVQIVRVAIFVALSLATAQAITTRSALAETRRFCNISASKRHPTKR